MSEVKLSVGGRDYTVACADGEEAHVTALGATIDAKLQQLGGNLSPQESQNLLFGALLIADELYEAKKVAEQAQTDLERELKALVASKQEASLAVGQRDALNLTISRLETELDGLQSSQQRHSAEVDDMREELVQRRKEAQSGHDKVEKLSAEVAELKRERDGLNTKLDNKNLLLEKATTHMDELNAKLAEARNTAGTPAPEAFTDDPDLAPALERFADLLESCADKLEGQPISA